MTGLPPPTYEDVKLILRLYELRRDEKLRAAREWFRIKFWPQTIDDLRAVLHPKHPENTHFRMVTSYWDMAASFVVQGVLHPELFLESAGELLFVWAKLEQYVEQLRKDSNSPALMKNVEKAIAKAPSGPEKLELLRARMARFREMMQEQPAK